MTFFSIPFLIAMLIQATKIVDLIFTDKQKKIFQDKVELFTLKLDFAKPLKYLSYLFEKKRTRRVLIIAGLILPTLILNMQFTIDPYPDESVRDLLSVLVVILILLCQIYLGFEVCGKRLMNWLTSGRYRDFVLRFLLFVIIAGIAVLALNYMIGVSTFGWPGPGITNKVSGVVAEILFFTAYGFIFGLAWTVTFYGVLVLLFGLILLLVQFIVRASNVIMWRIVQYNKGAVAAITLLLTFLLGIADIIVRIKK